MEGESQLPSSNIRRVFSSSAVRSIVFMVMISYVFTAIFIIFGEKFGYVAKLDDSIKFASQFVDNFFPMLVAFIFGIMGAWIYILRNRTDTQTRGKMFSDDSVSNITGDRLMLGGFLGLVSHLVVQSKFLIKLMYPSFDLEKTTPSFVGLAIVSILVGFYAEKLLGFADDQVGKIVNGNKEKIVNGNKDVDENSNKT